ncbi:MAG: WbuC family cupin fold metalloprotein [Bacteroidales bacterium]|nr:WbuC family cupin fold metalloprotein [Bacteroidales bacterium]MBN2762917.1 WbuC family cupin fold metalloprotein [Bacteroidales bacterium]
MIRIDKKLTDRLIEDAIKSARKRKNYNFHTALSDPMNRMLHAMEPETYVQPHKHENPDKREAFLVLKGRVVVVEFSDKGEIEDYMILDPKTGHYGAEIQPRTWHTLLVLEKGTLVYEVKDGPYDPADDKFFAPWAPKEGEEGCEEFKKDVLSEIGL